MPKLDKEAFSRFLRTGCQRQLRLYLYRADNQAQERAAQTPPIPNPQPPRPGLAQIRSAGEQWAAEKLADLYDTFPAGTLVGDGSRNANNRWVYKEMALAAALQQAKDALQAGAQGCFCVESQFVIGSSFERAVGIAGLQARHGLVYAGLRTDLIEVRLSDGQPATAVHPDGELRRLPADDTRLRLSVSEIKLQSEPSANYFAEVVLYAMAMAAWLEDQGLADTFVVVTEGSFIWKGSTSQSALRRCLADHAAAGMTCGYADLRRALDEDVEAVPYEVFTPRVRNFFRVDLPGALAEPDWTRLDWHVDHRCTGCEFAGFPWGTEQPDHCIPSAERAGHLSRIAYVSRGAKTALEQSGVGNLRQLAALTPDASAFDRHQALRATRTVIAERVRSLQAGQGAGPAPDAGGSAVMPRFAQLQIFLTAHFDPSSAVTIAFGLTANYIEPWDRHQERERANGGPLAWERRDWRPETWVVPSKDDPAEEEQVLLRFLERIHEITQEALALDPGQRRTRVQVYLWDNLELKHLSRVIGRHLEAVLANDDTAHLAWLFPSDEVVQNARQASRTSPLTVVSDVVRSVLAAPVAHVYSLLPLARAYHPAWSGAGPQPAWWGTYSTHPLFEDPFSDQIPAERIHEIWSRSTRPSWGQQQAILVETIQRRLSALRDVTRQLGEDLRPVLRADAPVSAAEPLRRLGSASFDGELWYAFAKLNAALSELEVLRIRAMPAHEREARFRSAILERRLVGQEEADALQALGLRPQPGRRIYRLGDGSREVRVRENDFNVALAPLARPGFLDERYRQVVDGTSLANQPGANEWKRMEELCKVDVIAFDRERGNIVLDPGRRTDGTIDALEQAGIVDFSTDVTLDPVHGDFFTGPLGRTLQAIGNPPLALTNPITPRVRQAIGQVKGRGARRGADSPAAEVLWTAGRLAAAARPVQVAGYRQALAGIGLDLNDSQWDALAGSLGRTLSVIWGPPGTGKSRTLRALLAVAILDAITTGRPLRLLLSAGTYTAIDTVLLPLVDDLERLVPAGADFEAHRLRSTLASDPDDARALRIDRPVNKWSPDRGLVELRRRIHAQVGVTLVAGTPQQVHNLLVTQDGAEGSPSQEAFDLIALDEASQVDVALSILAIAGRAEDGQVIFAGDHLQLAPVHQAEPPRGLEAMVGSVYGFMVEHHQVTPTMLEVNYRSNQTIVDFAHHAGYRATLRPNFPALRLRLEGSGCPPGWPATLRWGPEWDEMIDPAKPAVAFVYPDAQWSSHSNEFEADAVAGLSCVLRARLLTDLDGGPAPGGPATHWDDEGFWTKGLGIVTPHRAQVALVLRKLQAAHGVAPSLLRGAVDTVERFQGQERKVIIASYAVGDPDAIRDEEEFLMSLNRFNVMASRAEAKLIVLVSQAVVDHLAGEIDVLRASGLLKTYVASFCTNERPMSLTHTRGQGQSQVVGQFRFA